MTSGNKKKADLVALFRLEFYRKQSNWKFCSQVQKAKKSASADKATCTTKIAKKKNVERCLNKTYNIETKKDAEKSVLNEAFLETEDDKILPSSPENSAQTPTKEWIPKIIRITDKWSPPVYTSLNNTVNIDPEKPESTGAELESRNSDLNLTGTVDSVYQIWPQHLDAQKRSWPVEDQNWEQFWPYLAQNQNDLENKEKCDEGDFQEKTFDRNWLHPEIKYKDPENYYQNCNNTTKDQIWPENTETWQENANKVMQYWANIPVIQNNEKQLEINNNDIQQDTFWSKNKMSEPIYANMVNWKEVQMPYMDTLERDRPGYLWEDVQWQDSKGGEIPDMDQVGQEGGEAEWTWETQIRSNNLLYPECIWSDDVLRELELLNVDNLTPEEPPEEKWVSPDRLLQWMLANKECYNSVLEVSNESLEQFMRAAHCAPHSSEIDLQPQLDALEASLEACPAVGGEVGAWTVASVRAAGPRHARALRRVARELRRSNSALPSTPTPHYDVSCEEYPTRDIGLTQPAFIDTFISGSYKNDPNNKQLDKNKSYEKLLDLNEKEGFIRLEEERIVVRGKTGELGQKKQNVGQAQQNWGQLEPNRNVVNPSRDEMTRLIQKEQNMGQAQQNWGQVEQNRNQLKPSRDQMTHLIQKEQNMGQAQQNWGQVEQNRNQLKLIRDQMTSLIQKEQDLGQTEQNWGQLEPNRNQLKPSRDQMLHDNQVLPNWGKKESKRCPTASLRVLGGQIVIDQNEISEDLSVFEGGNNQWGGFGSHEVIGRGRGRLIKDIKTVGGRGRGRL